MYLWIAFMSIRRTVIMHKEPSLTNNTIPLFSLQRASGIQSLTYTAMAYLSLYLRKIGLNSLLYAGHIFRFRRASFALERGVPAKGINCKANRQVMHTKDICISLRILERNLLRHKWKYLHIASTGLVLAGTHWRGRLRCLLLRIFIKYI